MKNNKLSKKPLVSIIIPTYGGSDSLEKAIESVLQQKYENFNIIVVDDNNPSTVARDKTVLIMKKYADNDQIVYIQHEKNKNGAAARNTGVSATNAKYICLLDDDDIFLPNRISKQVDFLENNNQYQACYCWRTQNGKDICGTEVGNLSMSLLDLSFTPTTSAIMLTRESFNGINGFDESYRRHQDYEFLLRYFKKYQMGVVPEILLEFLGNEVDNQVYGKKLYDLKATFFDQFSNEIDRLNNSNSDFKKRVYAAHFASACIQLLRKGNIVLAFKMYIQYGVHGGVEFWKIFLNKSLSGIIRKIESSK